MDYYSYSHHRQGVVRETTDHDSRQRRCHCAPHHPPLSLLNYGLPPTTSRGLVQPPRAPTAAGLAPLPHRLGQVLMLTVLLFACWQVTRAELVFHRRDHRDQGRHAQTNRQRMNSSVRNYSDAVHYLQKYGYLDNCNRTTPLSSSSSSSSSRSKRHLPRFLASEVVSERTVDCSDAMIADALKRLQQKYDLPPSGRLDTNTRLLMSKGRCGNSDIAEAQPTPPPSTPAPVRQRRDSGENPDVSDVDRRSHDNLIELLRRRSLSDGRLSRRRRFMTLDSNWTEDGFDGREESNPRDLRGAEEDEEEEEEEEEEDEEEEEEEGENNYQHVLRKLTSLREHKPESSSKRLRQQMLEEITNRLLREMTPQQQQQQQQERHPTNRTDEEQVVELVQHSRQLHRRPELGERRRRRRRRKRTIILDRADTSEGTAGDRATKFQLNDKFPVRWRLLDDGISGKIPLADQRATLELSFRMWSEVIPLKFVEVNEVDSTSSSSSSSSNNNNNNNNKVDVVIAFAKKAHMNCDKPFDGIGGELAHSWKAGDIHFDEDENYKRVDPSGSGINLLKVAVHEVGHVLGLLHNKKDSSIMYPIYINPAMYDDFELSLDDRKAVQNIYGVCKGTFNAVFDWLRKVRSSGQDANQRPRYIFNTYFFRTNRYWMYENRFNRTRFGDPLHISRGWTGIEGPIDGYTQVISSSGQEYNIETYFFVDDSYYKYNDETDQVEEGYPRKIASDFGPKPDSDTSLPNAFDAVLFDNRDSLLYFFKGEWVWTYDPTQIGRNACCEGKYLFSQLFPMDSSSSSSNSSSSSADTTTSSAPSNSTFTTSVPSTSEVGLTGALDTVFYSYHFHTIFFFRGEDVYENAAYNDQRPGVNRLRHLGAWYQIWHDICDVE